MSFRSRVWLILPLLVLAPACQSARRNALVPIALPQDAVQDADALFRAQKWAEAAAMYERRTAADPDDAQAWYRLGYCLHALGRLDAAIPAHEKASRLPGTRANGAYNLACAHALRGDADAAFAALDRALDAGFRDGRQLANDADLASLRGDSRWPSRAARLGVATRDGAFDFWVGEWDVFDPSGKRVGGNVITSVERGFVIQENWTDAGGGTGRSLNFVDPSDGRWNQVWVDDSGRVTRYSGGWNGTSMALEGTRVDARGKPSPTRCTFTPAADGSVRQVIEDAGADGAFQVTFDGTYRRKQR
jgi:hypothetical protein